MSEQPPLFSRPPSQSEEPQEDDVNAALSAASDPSSAEVVAPPIPEAQQSDESADSVSKPELKPSINMTEAPASFYTVMYPPEGGWVSVTVRGTDALATAFDFANTIDVLKDKFSWSMTRPESQGGMAFTPSAPINPEAKAPPTAADQTTPPQSPDPTEVKGTNVLHMMIVNLGGKNGLKAEFYVGNFRYPFSDSRDPKTWAGLFDPKLKLSASDFEKPVKIDFDIRSIFPQVVYADWEKVSRNNKTFYNINRIHL